MYFKLGLTLQGRHGFCQIAKAYGTPRAGDIRDEVDLNNGCHRIVSYKVYFPCVAWVESYLLGGSISQPLN